MIVSGLPKSCSWQDLKDHMRKGGEVTFAQVRVLKLETDRQELLSAAMVCFADWSGAGYDCKTVCCTGWGQPFCRVAGDSEQKVTLGALFVSHGFSVCKVSWLCQYSPFWWQDFDASYGAAADSDNSAVAWGLAASLPRLFCCIYRAKHDT